VFSPTLLSLLNYYYLVIIIVIVIIGYCYYYYFHRAAGSVRQVLGLGLGMAGRAHGWVAGRAGFWVALATWVWGRQIQPQGSWAPNLHV